MRQAIAWLKRLTIVPGILLFLASGCGSGGPPITPRGDEARVAVESALSAWRDGSPYDKLEAKPAVRVVDSAWREGQKIDAFEILDEEGRDDGTKAFSVKLSSSKPKGEKNVKFVVYGQDPLWVYREEDYQRMLQMDNNPAATRAKARTSRRGG
jgi:hypothetical protein